jgi:ankyrin repeat protein
VRWLSLEVGGADINEWDKDHRTPLCCASGGGSVEVAKLLIECGADVKSLGITVYSARWTPLQAASRNGRVDVVQLLLDYWHGAEVSARKQDQ